MTNYSYDFESKQFAEILKQIENIKPVLVFGVSEKKSGKYFNSAVVVNRGNIIGVYRKTHLINPNELTEVVVQVPLMTIGLITIDIPIVPQE